MDSSLGGKCRRLSTGIVVLAWFGGCGGAGDDLPRQEISGSVILQGTPLSEGMIQFRPETNQGTFVSAAIRDGKYAIPRHEGPVAGGYRVIITSPPKSTAAASESGPGKAPPSPPDLIPKKYNASSTLNAEVKVGQPNSFDFDLKK
ncbi:hypothetical protein SAMN05444166_3008 [Singulisphaera sp. GP187]|uniref:hypothetical protein n=1 Tax=Singulisphaera sp. GP187 TaxID=1882752 RepID=UPI00092992D6|nr:hypothetical protein [Singulisphaera sp. GP187]SIO20948.1 hypothetical protein SAMN05444166_3008 [Singulisphaera sp. GP187]